VTVWWQTLMYSLVSLLAGSLLSYYFRRLGAKEERKVSEKDRQRNAARSILAEIEGNLKLAKEPWSGRIVEFVREMWNVHSGHVLELPTNLQDSLHRVYSEIQTANALYHLNLTIMHGSGFYDNAYTEQRAKIAKAAEEAAKLLREWLKTESEKE